MDESSLRAAPFDLHVLSTPPAFILSQDQTLNKMVLKRSLDRSNQIIETKIIASKKFNVVPDQACLILTTNPNLVLRVFITLFNLQGARRPAKLRYDIMPFSFCQALFSSFFELFQCLHPQGLLTCHHRILSNPAALSQALSYIITCSFTCQALFSDS